MGEERKYVSLFIINTRYLLAARDMRKEEEWSVSF